MLPTFPNSKRLSLNDRKEVEKYTKDFPPYSDYNFTSLWSYNTQEKINISDLNGNLIVKFQDYTSNSHFYSVIGKHKLVGTIKEIFRILKKNKESLILKLIPEIIIKDNQDILANFKVKEDIDNHDYIILAEHTAKLQGPKYHNKHSLINKFNRLYLNHKLIKIDLQNKNKHQEIMDVFEKWKDNKGGKADEKIEREALTRLLKSFDHFNLVAFGLYDKKMIGFSIFEILSKDYAIGHFIKGDKSYRGVFEKLYHHNANHFHSKGIKFINIEQDLGEKGLRLTKSLWRPIHFLKKYTIKAK